MTSDQGGRHGEPTGRPDDGPDAPPQGWNAPPQGWNAPPPPPGWQAPPPEGWNAPPPPQGWNAPPPPPGWQPQEQQWGGYGGYVPPPPPGSEDPPVTVRAGLGAFVATVVLGVVASLVMLANWDQILDEAIAQAGVGLSGSERESAEQIAEIVVPFSLALGAVFTALYLLVLWFAWRGRNWARVVLWVLGGLSAVSGFASLGGGGTGVSYIDSLNVFSWLLTLAGVVLLALRPSNEWYRYMSWHRTYGRQG